MSCDSTYLVICRFGLGTISLDVFSTGFTLGLVFELAYLQCAAILSAVY